MSGESESSDERIILTLDVRWLLSRRAIVAAFFVGAMAGALGLFSAQIAMTLIQRVVQS